MKQIKNEEITLTIQDNLLCECNKMYPCVTLKIEYFSHFYMTR